jgi:hypothetical protein
MTDPWLIGFHSAKRGAFGRLARPIHVVNATIDEWGHVDDVGSQE